MLKKLIVLTAYMVPSIILTPVAIQAAAAEIGTPVSIVRVETIPDIGILDNLAFTIVTTTSTTTTTTSTTTTTTVPPPPPWICPLQIPVRFTDDYGAARPGHWHQGVDLSVPWGTPIVAPVAGRVRFAADALGGNAFYLDGVDGVSYYGAHLSRYGQGGDVEQGTVIGYVGQTGDAASPHLHFEMHPGGTFRPSIDPYFYLNLTCPHA